MTDLPYLEAALAGNRDAWVCPLRDELNAAIAGMPHPAMSRVLALGAPNRFLGQLVAAGDVAAARVATLDSDALQGSRVKVYIAEFDALSGQITEAELYYDGRIDRSVLEIGKGLRSVQFEVGTMIERLLLRNSGNSLSAAWHKSIWPGETGHDQATGLKTPVAWGVATPPSGVAGGGGFGGGLYQRQVLQ